MKTKILTLLLVCLSLKVSAESKVSPLTPVNYANYLHTSIRANYSYIETGYINSFSNYYYLEKEKPYPVVAARFSFDIPLLAVERKKDALAITFPVQSTMIIDQYENRSAPVLNTDYIFGLTFKYYRPISHPILHNISVRATPIFHESTHIGDEFAIHGVEKVPHFSRINVSYEAWELYILLNDPYNTPKGNLVSVGLGVSGVLSAEKGYYSFDSLEVNNKHIVGSQGFMEYFMGANLRRQEGFLCSEKWTNIVSVELSNRVRYRYYEEGKEARVWSVNVLAGYEFSPSTQERWITNTGLYLRYYYGLNPHGMFRTQADYQFIGITSLFSLN